MFFLLIFSLIFRGFPVLLGRFIKSLIYNGNCTEWSAIWSEIKRVITKSHDREAGVRFVITSLISDQNWVRIKRGTGMRNRNAEPEYGTGMRNRNRG